jgi:CheY-like chemotaxis protein
VKILIADDSPTSSLILRRELESLGQECEVAGNEALERFRSGRTRTEVEAPTEAGLPAYGPIARPGDGPIL